MRMTLAAIVAAVSLLAWASISPARRVANMADDSVTVGTGGTIGPWYIDDAGGETDTNLLEQDPADPSAGAKMFGRPFQTISIFRVIVKPASFASQESLDALDSIPTVLTSPDQPCTIDVYGKKVFISQDRLIKDDEKVGQYRQVRRYETTGEWNAGGDLQE